MNCVRTLSFTTREEKCKSCESWIRDGRYPLILPVSDFSHEKTEEQKNFQAAMTLLKNYNK